MLLRCVRRIGGWPQVALVARVDGKIYFADGILPLLPVLERSIGVLSGHVAAATAPDAQPSVAMRRLTRIHVRSVEEPVNLEDGFQYN